MLRNVRESINKLKEKHRLINSHVENYYDESTEQEHLEFFTRIINRVVQGERSSIFINDPEKESVWLEVGTGIESRQITVPREGSMTGRVIASGMAEINNEMETHYGIHKEVDSSTGFTTRNSICVPVKSLDGKQVTGVIQVLNKENDGLFDEGDQKWLEEIAKHIQLNIENIYLHQESMSITDKALEAFTKLWNILIATILIAMAALFLLLMGQWLVM